MIFDGSGIFTSGALIASGSVRIILPPGVTLAASDIQSDYPGPNSDWYLLRFQDCLGCTLGGGGRLDGQARLWVTGYSSDQGRKTIRTFTHQSCRDKPEECRPRLLGVVNSSGVAVHNISIFDPVYWALHVIGSSDVLLAGLKISGDWEIPNNDGIDIDASSDVIVRQCWIDTADDSICIKTTRLFVPTQRIQIRNCTLRSRSSAFKIGSETLADISHIVVSDVFIIEAHRGLAIQLRDQGSVRNVAISRVRMTIRHMHPSWWGAAEPIYITSVPRRGFIVQGAAPGEREKGITWQSNKLGIVENVDISDVVAWAENGIFIAGTEVESQVTVQRVAIRNVTLGLKKLSKWKGGQQDYRPSARGVVESGKTAAFWVEGADNVILEGVKVSFYYFRNIQNNVASKTIFSPTSPIDSLQVKYYPPRRDDWKQVVHIDKGSTKDVILRGCEFTNVTAGLKVRRSAGALFAEERSWSH